MLFVYCFKYILFFGRYEAKRSEIEAWLARMENRAERMGGVATTADVLEAQQKEQKVGFGQLWFYHSLN